MDTIVLVSNFYDYIERKYVEIRQAIADKFGLDIEMSYEIPHISYQGGIVLNESHLKEKISDLVSKTHEFKIEVSGAGNFGKGILYLKPINNASLAQFHSIINNLLIDCDCKIYDSYSTENWIPHITLALGNFTHDKLNEVLQYIDSLNISWEITVSDLTLIKLNARTGKYDIIKNWTLSKAIG